MLGMTKYKITLKGTIEAIAAEQANPTVRNPNTWTRFIKWRASVDRIPYMEAIQRYGSKGTPEDRAKYDKFKTSLKQGNAPDVSRQPDDRGVPVTQMPSSFKMEPIPDDRGVPTAQIPSGFKMSAVPNDRGVSVAQTPTSFQMEATPNPRDRAEMDALHVKAVRARGEPSARKAARRAQGIQSAGTPQRRVARKRTARIGLA